MRSRLYRRWPAYTRSRSGRTESWKYCSVDQRVGLRQTIGILSNVHYQHPLWFSALPMNHLFCCWGFGWVDKAQSSDRLAFGAIGSSPDFKSRVFHDIWLLGICRETLFSSASNNPNSSKSFNPTAPPHVVPMYFKYSVHQCALKTVSGNTRLQVWHLSFRHELMSRRYLDIQNFVGNNWRKSLNFGVFATLNLRFFWGSSPRPPAKCNPPF